MEIEIIYIASRMAEFKDLVPQTSLKILFLDKVNLDFYENETLISREFLQDLISGSADMTGVESPIPSFNTNCTIDKKLYEWIKKSGEKPVSLEHIYENYSLEMLKNALPYLRDLKLNKIIE